MILRVVDASVAAKWLLPEEGAKAATALLTDEYRLHAPDLLSSEVANTVWKKVRRGEVSIEGGREAIQLMGQMPIQLHASKPLVSLAFELSTEHGGSVYDSLYLALAIALDADLVTADRRFVNGLQPGEVRDRVRLLV